MVSDTQTHWVYGQFTVFILDIFIVLFLLETADGGVTGNRITKTKRKKLLRDSLTRPAHQKGWRNCLHGLA